MKNTNRAPQRITPLSVGEHKGLAVQIPKNYSFARGINSVPLTITEFGRASISYPIVFTQSVFGLTPIALLGLRSAQNLCIDSDGAWMDEYVPSFLKHYPFFIGRDTDGLKVCIDQDWEGCNRIGRGEVLFDSEGVPTAFLKHIIASLSGYQKQTVITQEIMNRLSGLDVFEEGKIDYINDSNGSNRIRGVYIINREKLLELNPAVLQDLNSLHLLEYCFNHIHSLSTLGKLFNRMRDSGDPNYSEIKNFS